MIAASPMFRYLLLVAALCGLLPGCRYPQPTRTTGGSSPVTAERLLNAKLVHIRQPVSWSFNRSTVVIDNEGQPLPADIVAELLADGSAPKRIEAVWEYDGEKGELHLTDFEVDDVEVNKKVTLPISPAGHVRMDLGSRQYNVFPDSVKPPAPTGSNDTP